MNITQNGSKDDCCLVFDGEMTYPFSRDIENRIIDSMRCHRHLKVDLSGVREIDLCGVHLLGVMRSFGDDAIRIVATSPVVDAALSQLPSPRRIGGRGQAAHGNEHSFSPRMKP
jgi:hypothetical protein